MGVFDAFQIPYSALERDHEQAISAAADGGAGTIIRGGVARGAPEKPASTMDNYPERMRLAFEQKRERWTEADLDDLLDGMSSMEFLLRFTLSHPRMHTTIVGTATADHLEGNVAVAARGALPPDQYRLVLERLAAVEERAR